MDLINIYCYRETGSQNTFLYKGVKYFFEIDRKSYRDGKITGEVFRFNGCELIGTLEISSDGKIKKFTKGSRFEKIIRKERRFQNGIFY